MDHRGRHYGQVRRSYVVNTMNSLHSNYRLVDTQKVILLEKGNKKDLEARANKD